MVGLFDWERRSVVLAQLSMTNLETSRSASSFEEARLGANDHLVHLEGLVATGHREV